MGEKKRAVDELREWVTTRTLRRKTVVIPDLVKEAEEAFPGSFFERMGRESLHAILYHEIQQHSKVSNVIRKLRSIGESVAEREERLQSVFAEWFEEQVEGKKALLKMTRNDWLQASSIRLDRGAREIRHGEWLRDMGMRLKGNQTIEDVISLEELERSFKEQVLQEDEAATG
jgi:hypothetical protein